jgi:SpoVK/Ycf46/Vps4 family AAA+-type ATPase
MYVIRQALRASPGRPPARLIRGRRYPSIPRSRSFHTTRTLAQAAKPPSGSNNTPIGDNDASKPEPEQAAGDEAIDATVASEDAELLAQKLQRSREASRRYSAALRRQQRSKKSQGLPPVHIPDWFLKTRVTRHQDILHDSDRRPRPACLAVSISDAESGEQATCSIPASKDLDTTQVLSRLLRALWKSGLGSDEKHRIEQYLSERIALANETRSKEANGEPGGSVSDADPAPASAPDNSTSSTGSLRASETRSTEEHVPEGTNEHDVVTLYMTEMAKDLDKLKAIQADSTLSSQETRDAALKEWNANVKRWTKPITPSQKSQRASSPRAVSPFVLAEVRATIAASLSALRPSLGDTFPAAKTNLILHSPVPEHGEVIDECIHRLAEDLQSDVIVLTAQDLAQLAGDYLGEGAEPSPRSIRSLGYETHRLDAEVHNVPRGSPKIVEETLAGDPLSSTTELASAFNMSALYPLGALYMSTRESPWTKLEAHANSGALADNASRTNTQSETQLEDMKLAALLDVLLDANEAKQSRGLVNAEAISNPSSDSDVAKSRQSPPSFFDYSVGSEGTNLELNSALPMVCTEAGLGMTMNIGSSSLDAQASGRSKIVYVKDFKEMNATHYGGRLIQRLEELVRKRRIAGESIMIIGSTCSRELTPELSARYDVPFYALIQLIRSSGVRGLQGEGESSYFRTIVVEGESDKNQTALEDSPEAIMGEVESMAFSSTTAARFRSINLSHIREMLKSLDPAATANIADREKGPELFRTWAAMFPRPYSKRVLTYDEVHRIALTALGLYVTRPTNTKGVVTQMNWGHVALALGLLKASDLTKYACFDKIRETEKKELNERLQGLAGPKTKPKKTQDAKSLQRQRELQQIERLATTHEKWLMPGIVDPGQIKTTFDQVHVPLETIDSIRTVTSLSLLRPDAFNYGILATEKITGALLYGPPGTGKTLLAKAVAKESGSTVLEVSGAQILGKYVGESEKSVAAIFSLAQKLSPCIVFLDEADSIFGSRNARSDRSGHRETLNQFLKEWDGLNDSSVFMMVATNRPFDLDDAVLRRLPRRLLVDLPTQTDRKEILRIHLAGEQLDESVNLDDLAKRTPFYSGSDLKNVAVSAALACVKEENEQAALAAQGAAPVPDSHTQSESTDAEKPSASATPSIDPSTTPASSPPKMLHLVPGQTYNFPAKRTLHIRHFDKALQEISASISEDMSTLTAIRKFDEQYGDRKGKKRRKDFGFGVTPERSESAARVRV